MVILSKYAVSKVVESIKKNTSRYLSRKFVFLKQGKLGQKRHLEERLFCIYGRNKRRNNPKIHRITRSEKNGISILQIV